MTGFDKSSQRTLLSNRIDLGGGRTFPRDLYRARYGGLRYLAIAGLAPFALLIAFGFVPTTVMLAIAGLFNDLIWAHFRQVSFNDCGDRCWARAYTLISTTVLSLSTGILGVSVLRSAMVWFSACEEALRQGAAPYGLTSRGMIARGPLRSGYMWVPVVLAVGLLIIWWLVSVVCDFAGSDWNGSRRRGLNVPAVFSCYWTGLLATIQLLVSCWIIIATPMVLHIHKFLRSRNAGT